MEDVRQRTVELMESFQQQHQEQSASPSFSPKELYRLGCVLHQIHDVLPQAAAEQVVQHDVQSAYHQFLRNLPQRRRYFDGLHQGLQRMLLIQQESTNAARDDVTTAIAAVDGLYRCSDLAEASSSCTIQTIHALADHYHQANGNTVRDKILSLVFRLLWKTPSQSALEWSDLLPVLEYLQETRVWKPLVQHLDEIATGWQEAWLRGCADEAQREYLTSWLRSASSDSDGDEAKTLAAAMARVQTSPKARPKKTTSATNSANDALQRQIDQVRSVLPQYGEGLVELALSLRQGQVEDTVALLSSPREEWPTTLQTVDPALPRRHRSRVAAQDALTAELTKEALRAADEQQEREALIMTQLSSDGRDEYNDDYDDQWDAVDTAAANDGGLYDDYQAVRTYNRVVREAEREAAFWQANANTNRPTAGGGKSTSGGFRGPDKLKGGRLPKPPNNNSGEGGGGGGGGGGGNQTNNGNNRKKKTENPKGDNAKKDAGREQADTAQPGKGNNNNNDGKPTKAAQRQKERKMAKRKEKQRQAMNDRAG